MENISKASKSNLADVDVIIKRLNKGITNQETNFKKLIEKGEEQFVEGAKKKYKELESKLVGFSKDIDEINEKIKKYIFYFGYTEKDNCYKKFESFFQILYDCAGEMEKFMPKAEPKKVFKGNHKLGAKIVV